MQLSLGRRDGPYHAQTPNFYQDLLEHARQLPVIVQDMDHGRAWHLDGQRFILGAIQHRHCIQPYTVHSKPIPLHCAGGDDIHSVHLAMLQNREIVLRHDRHLRDDDMHEKLYRHEVHELYERLESLQAALENVTEAGIELKLSWGQSIQGWSYTELVEGEHRMMAREAALRKTCGLWPALARDIGAVVLFGANFDEILEPLSDSGMCEGYKEMPKHYDFLAIEVSHIKTMLQKNRNRPDQGRLTSGGLHLLCLPDSFKPCQCSTIQTRRYSYCNCKRITQLSTTSKMSKLNFCTALPARGGILISLGSAYTHTSPRLVRNTGENLILSKRTETTAITDVSSAGLHARIQQSVLSSVGETHSNNSSYPSSQYSGTSSLQVDVGGEDNDTEISKEAAHKFDANRHPRDNLHIPQIPTVYQPRTISDTTRSSNISFTRYNSGNSDSFSRTTAPPDTVAQNDDVDRFRERPNELVSLRVASSGEGSLQSSKSRLSDSGHVTLRERYEDGPNRHQSLPQPGASSQVEQTLRRKRHIDFASLTMPETKRPSLSVDRS